MHRIGLSLAVLCLGLGSAFAQEKGLTVDETPAEALEKKVGVRERYALLVGISKYANASINLNYADADALELERVLLDPEIGGYKRENVKVLVNEEATRANILEALKEWLGYRVKPEDSVVILYSGHGALGTNKDAYWVTHDADVNRLYATAISNKEISSLIAELPAQRKVTLIDSCYSEATAKDLKSMVGAVFEEFQGEGVVTITASKGNQKSVEVNGHGAFTFHLLDALRGKGDDMPNGNANGVVELDEIWRFLDRKVRETAAAQNNDQQPTMSGRWEHEFPITVNPTQAARATLAKLETLYRENAISRDELKDAEKLFDERGGSPQLRSLFRLLAAGDVNTDNFRKVRPLLSVASAPAEGVASARVLAELETVKKSAEATALEVAKAGDSELGWQMFLSKFPETSFRVEALRRIAEIKAADEKRRAEPGAYTQAETLNSEAGWENFIRQYPASNPLVVSAQARLETLRKLNTERENGLREKALKSRLPEDWDALIVAFPRGRFVDEAQREKVSAIARIDEENAYSAAKKGDSIPAWKNYLDKYPDTKNSAEAKRRSEQLSWLAQADIAAIPGGAFTMGSATGEADEKPQRRVEIDAFRMGRAEVTNDLYGKFLDETKRAVRPKDPDFAKNYMTTNPKYPVVNVTYADAMDFCKWLSEKVGAPVRLPTEAEWEYAALGGHDGNKFPWGAAVPGGKARFSDNKPSGIKTVERDAFSANDYGLYNMSGNVAEWVSDYYFDRAYSGGTAKNPTGPTTGNLKERVVRGGSFQSGADDIRVARRAKLDPARPDPSVGFRIVIK